MKKQHGDSRVAGPLAGRSASKLAGYTEKFKLTPLRPCILVESTDL
jgi:hypothetical protein